MRAVHRLSEDRKWDTEFMSRVKGAPWDFKADAGHDINDGGIPERADARPPDPPIDIPLRMNVRRMYIRRMDVEKYGPTTGGSHIVRKSRGELPSCIVATHSAACRERTERLMMQNPVGADRVVRTTTRHDEAFAKHMEEHDEREKKRKTQNRCSRDDQ